MTGSSVSPGDCCCNEPMHTATMWAMHGGCCSPRCATACSGRAARKGQARQAGRGAGPSPSPLAALLTCGSDSLVTRLSRSSSSMRRGELPDTWLRSRARSFFISFLSAPRRSFSSFCRAFSASATACRAASSSSAARAFSRATARRASSFSCFFLSLRGLETWRTAVSSSCRFDRRRPPRSQAARTGPQDAARIGQGHKAGHEAASFKQSVPAT